MRRRLWPPFFMPNYLIIRGDYQLLCDELSFKIGNCSIKFLTMQCLKQIERLHRIHRLIQHESTGSAASFAEHLHMSPRQLNSYMEILRDMGAPITFCSVIKSYKYSSPVKFDFELRLFVSDKLVYSLD